MRAWVPGLRNLLECSTRLCHAVNKTTLENRPYLLTSALSYHKYLHFHNDKPRPF